MANGDKRVKPGRVKTGTGKWAATGGKPGGKKVKVMAPKARTTPTGMVGGPAGGKQKISRHLSAKELYTKKRLKKTIQTGLAKEGAPKAMKVGRQEATKEWKKSKAAGAVKKVLKPGAKGALAANRRRRSGKMKY